GILARAAFEYLRRYPTRMAVRLLYALGLPFLVIALRDSPVDLLNRAAFVWLPLFLVLWAARVRRGAYVGGGGGMALGPPAGGRRGEGGGWWEWGPGGGWGHEPPGLATPSRVAAREPRALRGVDGRARQRPRLHATARRRRGARPVDAQGLRALLLAVSALPR